MGRLDTCLDAERRPHATSPRRPLLVVPVDAGLVIRERTTGSSDARCPLIERPDILAILLREGRANVVILRGEICPHTLDPTPLPSLLLTLGPPIPPLPLRWLEASFRGNEEENGRVNIHDLHKGDLEEASCFAVGPCPSRLLPINLVAVGEVSAR